MRRLGRTLNLKGDKRTAIEMVGWTTQAACDWKALGLDVESVLEMYRLMVLARSLDKRAQQLNRQGRAAFTVSCAGHEAAQIGVAWALRPAVDWVIPYYRDLALVLRLGVTSLDFILAVLAKPADRSSGGKQTPGKYSDRSLKILSSGSPVATQLPHAAGIAYALKAEGSDAVVVVGYGEGGGSEGDTHEAFNFAAIHRLPVIFLCENNSFAISTPFNRQYAIEHAAQRALGYGFPGVTVDGRDPIACYSAARDAISRARAGHGPTLIEAMVDRLGPHSSDDDPRRYRSANELAEMEANDCLARYRARLLADGAGDETLLRGLEITVEQEVERVTKEAFAYPDAVASDALTNIYSEVIPRSIEAPISVKRNELNMVEAIRATLMEEMDRDDRVVILGEDVAAKGGVFLATEGLLARFSETRVIDMPLAESSIAGVALGLAVAGKRPVAEMQFADFAFLAFNQMVNEIAKLRYRTNGDWDAPLVIRAPIGGHVRGGLYHSQSIEARFASPGLKIVVPSTPAEAKGLLIASIRDPDPVLFLEHKRLYRMFKEPVAEGEYLIPLQKARVAREGSDVVVLTYGLMVHYALAAADELEASGIQVEILDLRTVYPLDTEAILASVRRIGKVLVLYEENLSVAIGSEISAVIGESAFEFLDAPIRRLGGLDVPAIPFAQAMEDLFMPNQARIAAALRELAAY
jgi:2-oxoisovalerate dehydrogenase E1 component